MQIFNNYEKYISSYGQIISIPFRAASNCHHWERTLRILTPILAGKFSKFSPPAITLRLETSLVIWEVELLGFCMTLLRLYCELQLGIAENFPKTKHSTIGKSLKCVSSSSIFNLDPRPGVSNPLIRLSFPEHVSKVVELVKFSGRFRARGSDNFPIYRS